MRKVTFTLRGIAFLVTAFFVAGCEQKGNERTTSSPPSVITMQDIREFVFPPNGLESKYDTYLPSQVVVNDPNLTPASSGNGFILRFSWDFTAPPEAARRTFISDWTVKGAEEGNSNREDAEEKFFYSYEKKEFVSYKKLEAGKVYVFTILVQVRTELDNGDLFLSEIVLKKIRVDLRDI